MEPFVLGLGSIDFETSYYFMKHQIPHFHVVENKEEISNIPFKPAESIERICKHVKESSIKYERSYENFYISFDYALHYGFTSKLCECKCIPVILYAFEDEIILKTDIQPKLKLRKVDV